MHSQLSTAKLLSLFTALTLLCTAPLAAQTLGSNFTYQGQLKQGGSPLNATADFEFKLFNAPTGGTQVGSTVPLNNVNVVGGVFTVSLNFGTIPFNGDNRWLEVFVRSPGGGGAFTLLTPRQQLTAAPYALYALSGPGSGGPWAVNGNNIFNTNTGNVGIGTNTPGAPIHIANDLFAVLVLQDTGPASTQAGYVTFWNNTMTETAWVGFGTAGSPHFSVVNARSGGHIILSPFTGNVGIGTETPAAKLQVNGDIRLGPSGQYRAPAGEENLRIVRGIIADNGAILSGSGFSVQHLDVGQYFVSFNTAFANTPTVTATADRNPFVPGGAGSEAFHAVMTDNVTASTLEFVVRNTSASDGGVWQDRTFQFIAIGPR